MGGKTGETIVQRYIAVLVRCLGLMTVRKEGVEFFLRPQKFGKMLQRYFIHIVKKKPRTWKRIRQTRVYDEIVRHKYGNAFTLL